MKVYPFIEAEKAEARNVTRCCELLSVSKSAFYAHLKGPSARELKDAELSAEIFRIHEQSKGTYGAPRIHAALKSKQIHCAKKRVARLMSQAGLIGRCRRSYRPRPVVFPTQQRSTPNVINRDFSVGSINNYWCGDITYVPTKEGWLYLATVLDIGSRKVIGWATSENLHTDLIERALRNAHANRRPKSPVTFHSDQGCQYRSAQFEHTANKLNIELSFSRKGQCWDNAVAEAFFATIKGEVLDQYIWPTRSTARHAIFEFIEGWYNTRRLHSALGYLSPNEYEAKLATA